MSRKYNMRNLLIGLLAAFAVVMTVFFLSVKEDE